MYSYWPAIIWSAIILVLLIIPGQDLPNERTFKIPGFDKLVHFGIFSLFVVLWCWGVVHKALSGPSIYKFLLITAIGVLFGYAMELVQKTLVSHRDYDLWDAFADAMGCVIGLIISMKMFAKK